METLQKEGHGFCGSRGGTKKQEKKSGWSWRALPVVAAVTAVLAGLFSRDGCLLQAVPRGGESWPCGQTLRYDRQSEAPTWPAQSHGPIFSPPHRQHRLLSLWLFVAYCWDLLAAFCLCFPAYLSDRLTLFTESCEQAPGRILQNERPATPGRGREKRELSTPPPARIVADGKKSLPRVRRRARRARYRL